MAQHQFQTEVSQLLHLIIHSLYSNKEIFLRELVSNASDALDKLKYLTVAEDAYKSISFEPRVDISFYKEGSDAKTGTLTIADNGIGMNEADLVESLGTIARSGTKAFLEKLSADAKRDSNLIGQFGVGFYSAFMVADKIEVISRKAGEEAAWKWVSEGQASYDIEPAARDSQGTTVILHLNEEGLEYANRWSIEDIIKRYSNHVAFPIYLTYDEKEYDDKGKEKSSKTKTDRINSGTAIWRRSKSELKEEDYKEFYKQLGHDMDDPLFYVHTRAEGTQEYATLFYIPAKAPFDMYYADYKPGVKLYVKRVFITDDDKELMPAWLRFVRGVIDSEDLPLNVSREILQQNKILLSIKNASVKKLLAEFKTLSENNKEKWETFIGQYNRPLKEGLYQDYANREALQDLVRFKSSSAEGWTSFSEYVSRMKADQKHIYYITGGDEKTLKASPLLEAYTAKGIEVLVMADEIDDIVISSLHSYRKETPGADGKSEAQTWELKAVNRSGADEELGEKKDKAAEKEIKPVIEKIKKALGEKVKDVKLSRRLHDSPSCIVADENDPTMQMAQMMKAMGQTEMPEIKPILEVNGDHPIVARLKEIEDEAQIADIAGVLLDQALLVEGLKLKDPADFVKKLNRLLSK
ncbi:molecular chaperone HtpG [Leadbettera azotonutricia]|uniref:Chaperone protein HtpG n=1 Tax=Leadbettera azotonutricia (strain ATCC BAA-888 / DSM 13862 / ZAS-9) TaxID=545695 RepID=F5YCN5_LEAAZ|nr:molecular chaperone HtpG [Leadbettera azotonutricia]AEF80447.1 chaperone protein HtpG [Leadbettera azotonutricia ZAS-9]